MRPRSLHSVHDEEKPFELELAWVCEDSKGLFQHVPEAIAAEAEKAAKEAIEAADMCALARTLASSCCVTKVLWQLSNVAVPSAGRSERRAGQLLNAACLAALLCMLADDGHVTASWLCFMARFYLLFQRVSGILAAASAAHNSTPSAEGGGVRVQALMNPKP